MVKVQVLKHTFSKSDMKEIISTLEMITFDQSIENIGKQLEKTSPKQYLWSISKNPAYFVKEQVKSSAILKAKGLIFIVWKPIYIQYPRMVVFPPFNDKKLNNLKLQIDACSKTTQNTNQKLLEYLQSLFGTYFHTDTDFQTNLVTYAKHFVSKVSSHCYWHAVYDDRYNLCVTQQQKMDNLVKVHISGFKEGYHKTLFLFSYKGTRSNLFVTAKNKWTQIVSFLAMALIFYAVVACPSSTQNAEGICQYKSELTLFGAGLMLALIGLRYSSSKKDKKKNPTYLNPEKQKVN